MGREVRRVPSDWEHPRDKRGGYIPMFDESFAVEASNWKAEFIKWEEGFRNDYNGGWTPREGKQLVMEFWEWHGNPPDRKSYCPDWPEESRTHYQMYEDTTEGTPISPVFATPEELARWLADNEADAFGGMTATYEQWLRVCQGGYAPSMVVDAHGMRSGVAM
jgi:hypothetical protein